MTVDELEQESQLLRFCSFLSIVFGKKLNTPNIFLILLREKVYRDAFKLFMDIDSDYEVFKSLINYDPSLHRSKYISKYLNSARQNSQKHLCMS